MPAPQSPWPRSSSSAPRVEQQQWSAASQRRCSTQTSVTDVDAQFKPTSRPRQCGATLGARREALPRRPSSRPPQSSPRRATLSAQAASWQRPRTPPETNSVHARRRTHERTAARPAVEETTHEKHTRRSLEFGVFTSLLQRWRRWNLCTCSRAPRQLRPGDPEGQEGTVRVVRVLRQVSEACRATAAGQGRDFARAWGRTLRPESTPKLERLFLPLASRCTHRVHLRRVRRGLGLLLRRGLGLAASTAAVWANFFEAWSPTPSSSELVNRRTCAHGTLEGTGAYVEAPARRGQAQRHS